MSQVNADRINVGMAVKVPSLTQSQINGRSTQPGDIVYNSTEESMQIYNGLEGQWEFIGEGSSLYDFTTAKFTPGGKSGSQGPSLAQVRSGISGNDGWKTDTNFLNVNAGIIEWTVPADGTYTIQVKGAQGGRSNCYGPAGGKGAELSGSFSLSAGQKLKMAIGQRGGDNCYDCGAGGGTFVCDVANQPLIIAAGGGAGSASGYPYGGNGYHGRHDIQNGSLGYSSRPGGSNGGGGNGYGNAGGGGGLTGNGSGSWFGYSFTNGAQGRGNQAAGGFGGGGGGGGTNGAGGGGGYSGGAASRWCFYGAGGGSFVTSDALSEQKQGNNRGSHGKITVTKVS